jgi:hypothetical protein
MEYTQRGFRIHKRTKDIYGESLDVVQSSLATDTAVWIFGGNDAGIQVNREGAIEVIDGLTAFLAHTDNKGD